MGTKGTSIGPLQIETAAIIQHQWELFPTWTQVISFSKTRAAVTGPNQIVSNECPSRSETTSNASCSRCPHLHHWLASSVCRGAELRMAGCGASPFNISHRMRL